MRKIATTKMALAATVLMLIAASVAFLSGAGAQDRPAAERPVVSQAADDAGAEEAAEDIIQREPAQRPGADAGDASADASEDVVDAASAAQAAAEAAAADEAAGAVPVGPPLPIDEEMYEEIYGAFNECIDEIFQTNLPNGPADDADFQLIDDLIFENCVPLLPEEEQAAIIARKPYNDCVQAQYGDGNMGPMTEEEYMAIEAAILELCVPLLPEEEQAQILAYNAYQTCIEAALGDDHSQAAYAFAAQSCLGELPPELAEMEAMYINYQVCLAENGAFDNQPIYGPDSQYSIHISTPDGQMTVILGDEPSSVTIDSDGSILTVNADGDAQVFEMNYNEHYPIKDAAYEACADLSPYQDLIIDGVIVEAAMPVPGPPPPLPPVADLARRSWSNR